MTLGVGFGRASASIVQERVVTALGGIIGAVFGRSLPQRRAAAPLALLAPGLFWGGRHRVHELCQPRRRAPCQVCVLPLKLDEPTFDFASVNLVMLPPCWAPGWLSPANRRWPQLARCPPSLPSLPACG